MRNSACFSLYSFEKFCREEGTRFVTSLCCRIPFSAILYVVTAKVLHLT